MFKATADLTEGRSLKLTLPINILTPVNCWFEDQAPTSSPLDLAFFLSHSLSLSPHSQTTNVILFFYRKSKIEWVRHRERKRGREWQRGIAGSGGVRRGVWHPLSCLLKASFFPSLPPPSAADRRYFQGPRSAVLCLLHRLLEGSQKLKPEGVNRLGTYWRHLKGKKKKKWRSACVSAVCDCA